MTFEPVCCAAWEERAYKKGKEDGRRETDKQCSERIRVAKAVARRETAREIADQLD